MTLFATLIVSLVIPSLLVLLGECTNRLGNQTVSEDSTQPELNAGWFYNEKKGTTCGRLMPSMAKWPKFYAVFFVLFPMIYGLVGGKAVQRNAEGATFFDSEKDSPTRTVLTAGFTYVWVSVYFLSLIPFLYFLTMLQLPASKMKMDWVFETLPLNFGYMLSSFAGNLGVSFLVTGTFILGSVIDEETDEDMANLYRAAISGCWALCGIFGYKGFCKLFDSFYFGTVPGMRYLWFLGILASIALTMTYLSLIDDLLFYHVAISYGVFFAFPTLVWLLFTKSAKLPGGEGLRQVKTVTVVPPPVSQRELYIGRYAMRGSQGTELGASHWVWRPSRPHHLPISGVTVRVPTQNDANTRLMTTMALLEPTFIGAAEDSPMTWVRPFLTPFILPFILLALAIHQIIQKVGSITLTLEKQSEDFWVLVTPPVGRVVNTNTFDLVIYMVDGPGVIAGLGYMQTALASGNQNGEQRFRFIFKVDNVFDIGTLVYGIDQLVEGADFALEQGIVEFAVMITGGLDGMDTLVGGDKVHKADLFKMRTFKNKKWNFLNVDIDALCQGTKTENTAVVAIGSSNGVLEARDLVFSQKTKGLTFYDVVHEDSMFRMPIQNDPF